MLFQPYPGFQFQLCISQAALSMHLKVLTLRCIGRGGKKGEVFEKWEGKEGGERRDRREKDTIIL